MKTTIRNYSEGGTQNKADGLNPILNEYEQNKFVIALNSYLCSDDKHKYLSQRKTTDGSTKEIEYCTTICSFDIEVSSLYVKGEKRVVPYIWQIAIQDYVFYGRHFEDLVEMFDTLHQVFETNSDRRLIVWVHNLSYEFQAIRKYFKWKDVFLLEERKPIRALTEDGIEFRCSYLLSGMSLADLGSTGIHKGKVKKMVGDLDYSLVRHEKTPLTNEELQYCINDVLVVVEYITEQVNELYNGNITKIPMTKTGAVRQYVRSKTIENENRHIACSYRDKMKELTVDTEEYLCLTRAFSGGFTHANANFVGYTLNDVSSADISSSYPAVLCMEKYPMSKGKKIRIDNDWDLFNKLLNSGLMVFDIGIKEIESKVEFEHILQSAKCRNKKKCVVDNNRIVSAQYLETTITSVDFQQLLKYYTMENISIPYVWYYEADYLPRELIDAILQLYVDKTKLKGVGQELLYMLKKANLNSVYGMIVMAIVREMIIYNDDHYEEKVLNFKDCTDEGVIKYVNELHSELNGYYYKNEIYNIVSAIDKYNNTYSRFLYYPWGVFVTSYARKRLQDFILKTGEDHVYSDTDSDKFLNVEDHKQDVIDFNRMIDDKIERVCNKYKFDRELFYPTDNKGKVHPMGYLEIETEETGPYRRFKTLGAKRYLVEECKGGGKYVVKVTCAGVNKNKASEYIASQTDPFDFFNESMVIDEQHSGKSTASYIDDEHEFECVDYLGIKDICKVKSGTHLEPVSFKLQIDPSFKRFLANIENRKFLSRR